MVKFSEAETRLFRNRFVCRKCKSVIKASNMLVIQKKVSCRKCGSKALRPVRKK
jgi:ribosomal protein L40E